MPLHHNLKSLPTNLLNLNHPISSNNINNFILRRLSIKNLLNSRSLPNFKTNMNLSHSLNLAIIIQTMVMIHLHRRNRHGKRVLQNSFSIIKKKYQDHSNSSIRRIDPNLNIRKCLDKKIDQEWHIIMFLQLEDSLLGRTRKSSLNLLRSKFYKREQELQNNRRSHMEHHHLRDLT